MCNLVNNNIEAINKELKDREIANLGFYEIYQLGYISGSK